jgi:prepilin-type N-terminal cleavage/methylation domain-containing protein/prepilin-type processing-associated H-X9-DG protein
MKIARKAFTLVELLVVIGIIAVLVGILLPVVGRARQAAWTTQCASNLRNIGQMLSEYVNEYGVYPPSNYFKGLGTDPVIGQIPSDPTYGYVHWTALLKLSKEQLSADPTLANSNSPFQTTSGWEMFQCPALANGGLPPANPAGGNTDAGAEVESPGVTDWQAPRLGYTLNEAFCPRGYFQIGFRNAKRIYHFVRPTQAQDSSDAILATELWGTVTSELTSSNLSGDTRDDICGSRRPINGVSSLATGNGMDKPEHPYLLLPGHNFVWAHLSDLEHDPEAEMSGAAHQTSLDWVGRNHGLKTRGSVGGDGKNDWDLRKSNFLYLDGHVETKHVTDTVYPVNQWGPKFYSLEQ